ncbi:type II toxin-antitoxin system Phd/YefM family antitoxin [Eggerthia catenaformis]
MPQIRPITDLRNTTEISELCHAKHEPLFITKNGYGDLVVMSIETYEKILETVQIDTAINEAEKEFASGRERLDVRDALSSLRRKHFG